MARAQPALALTSRVQVGAAAGTTIDTRAGNANGEPPRPKASGAPVYVGMPCKHSLLSM